MKTRKDCEYPKRVYDWDFYGKHWDRRRHFNKFYAQKNHLAPRMESRARKGKKWLMIKDGWSTTPSDA